MKRNAFPILEFDDDHESIIEPDQLITQMDVPEQCVICFFAEVINWLVEEKGAQVIANSISEMGKHPLYQIEVDGKRLAFFHPGIGAPLAVALLEEMISRGCKKFMVCGGCGVLDQEIAVGHLLLPAAAIRDEGTSYHYIAPSREVLMDPNALSVIKAVLENHGINYLLTKTWTTDALYRETRRKAAAYLEEGCLVVEMEAAAFFAAAQFREVCLGQILYGGDAVIPGGWEGRAWQSRRDIRRDLFWLSAEIVFMM